MSVRQTSKHLFVKLISLVWRAMVIMCSFRRRSGFSLMCRHCTKADVCDPFENGFATWRNRSKRCPEGLRTQILYTSEARYDLAALKA